MRDPSKKQELTSLMGIAVQIILSLGLFFCGVWSEIVGINLLAVYSIFGLFIWLLTLLHLRQLRLLEEETLDYPNDDNENTLFDNGNDDMLSARNKLSQMEKWLFPVSSTLFGIILVIIGYIAFIGTFRYGYNVAVEKLNMTIVLLFILSFISFISGKFIAGMSNNAKTGFLLKGGAGYLLSTAMLLFLFAVSLLIYSMGHTWATTCMHYFIAFAFFVVGSDVIIRIIFDFYRPRVAGQINKPPYQSFLLGLLAEPQGIFKAAAHSLDYQFGFSVSETWFYRFVEKIIAPVILFQIITLYFLSCILVIAPHEIAVLERFGVPSKKAGVLKPGIHFKLPWPIEKARLVPIKRVRSVFINPHRNDVSKNTLVWSVAHHDNGKMILVPSMKEASDDEQNSLFGIPVNLLLMSADIQYTVNDPYEYLYNHQNVHDLIYNAGWREIVKYSSSTDFFKLMGNERIDIGRMLRENIQTELDIHSSGVDILFVGIYGLHPPAEVSEAFESVVSSIEEKQTKILAAQTYQNKIIPRALAKAKSIVLEAESYAVQRKLLTEAETEQFELQSKAYSESPSIYRWRAYLKTLKTTLTDVRKIIISSEIQSDEVDILDLKNKQLDLLDLEISRQ